MFRPKYEDDATLLRYRAGHRVEITFFCQICNHYVRFSLNLALNGNHVVICPVCEHRHFRVVKDGIITGERYDVGYCIADEIIPMKSAAIPAKDYMSSGYAHLQDCAAVGTLQSDFVASKYTDAELRAMDLEALHARFAAEKDSLSQRHIWSEICRR